MHMPQRKTCHRVLLSSHRHLLIVEPQGTCNDGPLRTPRDRSGPGPALRPARHTPNRCPDFRSVFCPALAPPVGECASHPEFLWSALGFFFAQNLCGQRALGTRYECGWTQSFLFFLSCYRRFLSYSHSPGRPVTISVAAAVTLPIRCTHYTTALLREQRDHDSDW